MGDGVEIRWAFSGTIHNWDQACGEIFTERVVTLYGFDLWKADYYTGGDAETDSGTWISNFCRL